MRNETRMNLEMLYTKDYFEEFARLILNKVFDLNLIHRKERYGNDRPDLISYDEWKGIEVTNAWSNDDGRHNKLLQYNYSEDNIKEEASEMAKRLKIGKELHFYADMPHINDNKNFIDWINILNNTIKSKLESLNKDDFNKYKENNLYINASEFWSFDIENYLKNEFCHLPIFEIKFNKIYIFNLERLYEFDGIKYKIYNIDNSIIQDVQKQSLEYARICKTTK